MASCFPVENSNAEKENAAPWKSRALLRASGHGQAVSIHRYLTHHLPIWRSTIKGQSEKFKTAGNASTNVRSRHSSTSTFSKGVLQFQLPSPVAGSSSSESMDSEIINLFRFFFSCFEVISNGSAAFGSSRSLTGCSWIYESEFARRLYMISSLGQFTNVSRLRPGYFVIPSVGKHYPNITSVRTL